MMWIARIPRCVLSILLMSAMCWNSALYGTNERIVPLQQIADAHKLHVVSRSPERFTLRRNETEFVFKNASRTFFVNNIKIPLGFPCSVRHRHLSILYTDYTTCVLPFLSTKVKQPFICNTIVIDPGHGGNDRGTVSNKVEEKAIAFDIAQKVAQKLSMQGYKVLMTRTTDTFIPLDQRTNFANQHHANIFISIHCNSAESKTANGIETFALTPSGQPSSNKNPQSLHDSKIFPNNRFDRANLLLAYHVQKRLIQQTHALDRGVKHSRFQVLKRLNCPGILIECGFLSNSSDYQKLTNEKYRQALAEAICSGILNFTQT